MRVVEEEDRLRNYNHFCPSCTVITDNHNNVKFVTIVDGILFVARRR
jgi:hypothetical protein